MNNISLLLLAKNEQDNLKEWGKWIHKLSIVNEIVVIDDESTDNTFKILKTLETKNLKINIFKRKLDDNFSKQRNYGINKCQNNWILCLDADEKPSPKTIDYLNKLSPKNGYNYSFKRNLIYFNHIISHGQCLNDCPIKLFNKNEGQFINKVHEVWDSPVFTINTGEIINHYSFKDLYSFLHKINFYSSLRSQELFEHQQNSGLLEIIFYPFFKFLDLYLLKLGFLDGTVGIIISLCFSLNSFLIRAKLWHLSQK